MPVSPFDIARTHVRLPVNRDYGALKAALRDWLRYTEHTSLQEKAAFPAALQVEVRRPPPNWAQRKGGTTRPSSLASAAPASSASVLASRLGAWRRRYGTSPGPAATSVASAAELLPHVYRRAVPLTLYTALLPWEVQRGLSKSELALPRRGEESSEQGTKTTGEGKKPRTDAATAAPAEHKEEEEEDDPLGVVTTTRDDDEGPAPATAVTAAPHAVPGMLFVLDLQGVQENEGRIGFWSGAITQPIDVLFFSPTEAVSVARSASFQRIRQRDVQMQVEDNEVAPAVLARFFPKNELRSTGRYTLRLHTYGHLDPFPWCEAAGSDGVGERQFSVEVSPTRENTEDPSTLPRFVLETVRHTVSSQVQRALTESLADYHRVYGESGGEKGNSATKDEDVELEISLELSDALIADLMNKAQLHAHYVSMLEDAVQHAAAALNRPTLSDASADSIPQQPPRDSNPDADESGAPTAGGVDKSSEQRMQVWLSETERVWMTPSELAAYQQKQKEKHHQTPWEAKLQDEELQRRELEEQEDDDNAAYMEMEEEGETPAAEPPAQIHDNARPPASHQGSAHSREPFSSSVVVPARSGAVRADVSIHHQSPMLKDENEGRPSYLAPSFTGRHEAATLYPSSNPSATASADKLARYPRTRSEMPVLPPVDYELLDLCLRLGVGQSSVLYHYYERILREWRQVLKALKAADAGTTATPKLLAESPSEEEVQLMSALVHDTSLQVPQELRSLVDAVVSARKKRVTRSS